MTFLVVLALIALIPAAIARNKGKSFGSWYLYGLLLFPIAVIHAVAMGPDLGAAEKQRMESESRRKCPHCAELIKIEAQVCRYCGRDVREEPGATESPDVLPIPRTESTHARPSQAPTWCVVASPTGDTGRNALRTVLQDLKLGASEIDSKLSPGAVTVARSLTLDEANALMLRLHHNGIAAQKHEEVPQAASLSRSAAISASQFRKPSSAGSSAFAGPSAPPTVRAGQRSFSLESTPDGGVASKPRGLSRVVVIAIVLSGVLIVGVFMAHRTAVNRIDQFSEHGKEKYNEIRTMMDGGSAHERLAALSDTERNARLSYVVQDEGCGVVRSFFQGFDKAGVAYWNVACGNGKALVISIANDSQGSTRILDCSVMKAMGAVECFRKL